MNRAAFVAGIKAKYPVYAVIPDDELFAKVITKYPQYKEQIQIDDEGSAGSFRAPVETVMPATSAGPPQPTASEMTPGTQGFRDFLERSKDYGAARAAGPVLSILAAGAGGGGMAARAAGGMRFARPAAALAKDMLVAQGVEEVAKRSGIPGASVVAEVMLGGKAIRSGAPKLLEKSLRAFAERKAAREAAKRVAPAAVRAATTAAASPGALRAAQHAKTMAFAKEAASKSPKLGEKIWMLLDEAGAPLRVLTPDQAGAAARAGQATTWVKNLWR